MEQAILDFIRENPQGFIASDEEDEDLRAATGGIQPYEFVEMYGCNLSGHMYMQS